MQSSQKSDLVITPPTRFGFPEKGTAGVSPGLSVRSGAYSLQLGGRTELGRGGVGLIYCVVRLPCLPARDLSGQISQGQGRGGQGRGLSVGRWSVCQVSMLAPYILTSMVVTN